MLPRGGPQASMPKTLSTRWLWSRHDGEQGGLLRFAPDARRADCVASERAWLRAGRSGQAQHGGCARRPHPTLYSRQRAPWRLRRGQAQKGLEEGPRGGRHFRAPLLALRGAPATEQDRARVEALAGSVQEATGECVELAYVDRGCTSSPSRASLCTERLLCAPVESITASSPGPWRLGAPGSGARPGPPARGRRARP
jgi:hypothetical protein